MELHGGTVRAASEGEGKGATFSVYLPISPVREERLPATRSGDDPALIDTPEVNLLEVKVLVVDDDLEARELIKRILAQANADVLTAGSGTEALEILATRKLDVLISDIGMPQMDGCQFIRKVRQLPLMHGSILPAVALTAYARSEDRTRAMLAGYQVHISKPIEPRELLATVASFAGRTSASPD